MADRYDAKGLMEEALETFGFEHGWDCRGPDVTCHHVLSIDEAATMIRAYYDACSITDSRMGARIATFMLDFLFGYMRHKSFIKLICQYPALAADVLLKKYTEDWIGGCSKRHE